METTKETLRLYTAIRDEILATGANDRLLTARYCCNVAMQGYRLQEDYLRAKARNPAIYVKWLEPAKAFTAAQRRDLEKAKAVNKEIAKLLGARRKANRKAKH